jgi:hypothetical protein
VIQTIKQWIIDKTANRWLRAQLESTQQTRELFRKKCIAEEARANRCLANWRSADAAVEKMRRKLERSAAWNRTTHKALQKMKEQSKLDHEMIEKLKAELEARII